MKLECGTLKRGGGGGFQRFHNMEVSAIGRRSLGSFGLSFLGIGITVESFQMSGMVHVSVEVWKRR